MTPAGLESTSETGSQVYPGSGEQPDSGEWVIDLEIAMVKAFGWSLRDVDETDIESLLPFMYRMTASSPEMGGKAGGRMVYADEANWL